MRKPITKCPHCGSDRGMAVRLKLLEPIYIVLMDIFKMKKLLNAVHIINV